RGAGGPPGRAHRHRQRGGAVRRRRRAAQRRGPPLPGRVDAVVGPVRGAERGLPALRAAPRGPDAGGRGRRQPGVGPLGRRQPDPRPLRRLRAGRRRARPPRLHGRQRGGPGATARRRPAGGRVTRLHDLYHEHGQSPWLDNLRRSWITGGELARWVERGVRGITSNPTIFQKAIDGSDVYDEQFRELTRAGAPVEDAYWTMVLDDIRAALAIMRPVHDASDGVDGYVSVEVAPDLAHDLDGTVAAARRLHDEIGEPNLFV